MFYKFTADDGVIRERRLCEITGTDIMPKKEGGELHILMGNGKDHLKTYDILVDAVAESDKLIQLITNVKQSKPPFRPHSKPPYRPPYRGGQGGYHNSQTGQGRPHSDPVGR